MIKVKMVDEEMQPVTNFEVEKFSPPKPNDLITFDASNNWWKILMVHQTTDEDGEPTLILKVVPETEVQVLSIDLTKKFISVYGKLATVLSDFLDKTSIRR